MNLSLLLCICHFYKLVSSKKILLSLVKSWLPSSVVCQRFGANVEDKTLPHGAMLDIQPVYPTANIYQQKIYINVCDCSMYFIGQFDEYQIELNLNNLETCELHSNKSFHNHAAVKSLFRCPLNQLLQIKEKKRLFVAQILPVGQVVTYISR